MSTQQTGTVTLVVNNVSKVTTYERTEFSFAGFSYFGIYPKIAIPNHAYDHVLVYWLNNSNFLAKVHLNVSILSESGEKLYTTEYDWQFDDLNKHPVLTFISRAKLLDPKNGYLVNDKLTLLCAAKTIDQELKDFSSVPQQDLNILSEDFQSLMSDDKFSDATLIVGTDGKKFNVHKAILSSRSAVFAAMFEHDCEEKRQNEVKITDIDPETCEELLVYIYTGKVKQMDRYALDLLQAADKYQLEWLKNICETYLCSTLSTETAANALFVADLHQATKLKDKCLEYICENMNQVKDDDGWNILDTNAKLLKDLLFYMANKNK